MEGKHCLLFFPKTIKVIQAFKSTKDFSLKNAYCRQKLIPFSSLDNLKTSSTEKCLCSNVLLTKVIWPFKSTKPFETKCQGIKRVIFGRSVSKRPLSHLNRAIISPCKALNVPSRLKSVQTSCNHTYSTISNAFKSNCLGRKPVILRVRASKRPLAPS